MATRTLIALQLPPGFTDDQGDVHAAAVAIPASMNQDIIDEVGGLPSLVFSSAAMLQAHKKPCAEHNTPVSKEAFVAGADREVSDIAAAIGMPTTHITEAQNTAYLWIAFAMSVADVAATSTDGTPQLDANGQPVMRPFFQGATPVVLQVDEQ